jgi:site-specific DNA recombinase
VRRIFDLYLGTDGPARGVKAIADVLNRQGVSFRGKRFSVASVHHILTRTTYSGTHYFDRRDSRTGEWKSRDEWVPVQVPPIIGVEVFDRVQATLKARNPKVTPPRVVSGPILLTGLARCASCGSAMTLRTGKGGRYRYYTCSRQAIQGKTGCTGRSIRMDKLDGLVLEQMAASLFATDRLMVLLQEYLDRSEEAQAGRREKLRQLKIEITEIDGRLRKLLAIVESGVMQPDDPILAERVAQIRLHRQETVERAEMLERELRLPGNQLSADKIAACGTLLREQLQNGDPAFRKAYLNLLIDQVEVDDSEVRIRGPKSALAAAASGKLPKPSDGVPSFVREWRARRDSNS